MLPLETAWLPRVVRATGGGEEDPWELSQAPTWLWWPWRGRRGWSYRLGSVVPGVRFCVRAWWLSGVSRVLALSGRRAARRCERAPHFLSWKPSGAVPEAVWTYSGKAGAAQPLEWRTEKTRKVRKENQERHVMEHACLAFSETKEV